VAEENTSIVICVLIIKIINMYQMETTIKIKSHIYEKQQNINHNLAFMDAERKILKSELKMTQIAYKNKNPSKKMV